MTGRPLNPDHLTAQSFYDGHMEVAEAAGLVEHAPLMETAGFKTDDPSRLHMFITTETNTENYGSQHRLLVMSGVQKDGQTVFGEPLEDFRWNISAAQGIGAMVVGHTRYGSNPSLDFHDSQAAAARLAETLGNQTGQPTPLVFTDY